MSTILLLPIAGILLWHLYYKWTKPSSKNNRLADLCIITLIAIRIWLGSLSHTYALPVAIIDDGLFLRTADSILSGEWLGSYDYLTLAKGPIYPIYLATISKLRIPLYDANTYVYAFSTWLLLLAFRQASPKTKWWIQTSAYSILLFAPVTIDSETAFRTIRQPLWIALCFIVFAASSGITTSTSCHMKKLWTATLGLALGLAWMTREEAIWLLIPSFASTCYSTITDFKKGKNRLTILTQIAPLVIAPLMISAISFKNYTTYGYFGIVETRGSSFVSAYGALNRVSPIDYKRRVPITKEARKRIYAISPSFRKLEPFIEGEPGKSAMEFTENYYGIPKSEQEIGGAFMLWVIREAVQRSGNGKTYRQSEEFYTQLAHEINESCKSGTLECIPQRDTLMPPIHAESHFARLINSMALCLRESFDHSIELSPKHSIGTQAQLELVKSITNQKNNPTHGKIDIQNRTRAWRYITFLYNALITPLCILSTGFIFITLGYNVKNRKRIHIETLIGINSVLCLLLSAFIVALIHTTSWDAIKTEYIGVSTCFSLVPLFAALFQIGHYRRNEEF